MTMIMNHLQPTAGIFLAAVVLLSNSHVNVNAAYPSSLIWSDCGQDKCATLEFCKDGTNYVSYRNPGDITPCGSKPGPLIRMAPGNTYKLTLHNSADDSTLNTNIHTRGLHITGSGDGDDITRFVTGGNCLDYTWDIPWDHPGGTNWYHPHYHTLTDDQIAGGAFGMIIIDDDYSQLNSWARPPNELLLLVSDIESSVLGNGNRNEVFQVEVGNWYRLRVSTVEPSARTAALSFNSGSCTVYKVASDGIWHNSALTTYSGSSFDMTGASRADYAISCAAVGSTTIKWERGDAATIEAGKFGSNTGSNERDLGNAPPKPASLTGLNTANPDGTFVISMSDNATINGQSWDEEVPLGAIRYDGIYEWNIIGTGAHPFHQYLYHMLIVEPGGCGFYQEGEFYDTLSASGNCRVRFYAIDIGQRMVLHFHGLGHEENGAMAWMVVTDTPSANQNNIDSPLINVLRKVLQLQHISSSDGFKILARHAMD
eukprot:scaffold60_cov137-Skeletonema_marinoi.AAC.1